MLPELSRREIEKHLLAIAGIVTGTPEFPDIRDSWLRGGGLSSLPFEPGTWLPAAQAIASELAQRPTGAAGVACLRQDLTGYRRPGLSVCGGSADDLREVVREFGSFRFALVGLSAPPWALISCEWYEIWAGPGGLISAACGWSLKIGRERFLRYADSFSGSLSDLVPFLRALLARHSR